MSSFGHKKGWTSNGLINNYQTNLELRIQKCDQSLVCRDEKLCKEVEVLLHKANAPKIHNLYGLDSLTVMEKSLHTMAYKTGQTGLERLSKAFEVLELAALNLYIYPWRSEYRTVKMFSGMFTHLIKSALSLQQAIELFGLLGYEPEEEELVLKSKRVPADVLLSLACGFFAARMECQMLLYTSGSLSKDVEWVVQLVKERQAGHDLQVALENTKRKSEVASALNTKLQEEIDSDLDLYRDDEADDSQVASTSCQPPHSPYVQSKDSVLNKPSKLDMENEDARLARSLNSVTGPMESSAENRSEVDAQRQAAANVMCNCITLDVLYKYWCEQCNHIHSLSCSHVEGCRIKGHKVSPCLKKAEDLYSTQDQLTLSKEKSKDSMKTHFCVASSSSKTFLVCYDCQLIHDHNCSFIKKCELSHNVQPTGILQPPQGERTAQKRHCCLADNPSIYAICHTCNYSHDCHCEHVQKCKKTGHQIQYSQETADSEAQLTYHPDCCANSQHLPESVCFTCKVFHCSGCPDGQNCSEKHNVKDVATKCITCFSSKPGTLCSYCGALYCTRCCFKNAMLCECGKILVCSSPV